MHVFLAEVEERFRYDVALRCGTGHPRHRVAGHVQASGDSPLAAALCEQRQNLFVLRHFAVSFRKTVEHSTCPF